MRQIEVISHGFNLNEIISIEKELKKITLNAIRSLVGVEEVI